MIRGLVVAAALVLVFALSGCTSSQYSSGGECTAEQNPQGQVAVCNYAGSFSYSYQASGYTKFETFTWENPLTKALVTQGSQIAAGTLSITLKDEEGKTVFTKTWGGGASQSGSSKVSNAGAPGSWMLELQFVGVTGQVGLTVTESA